MEPSRLPGAPCVLIVVISLAAEGTPRLALELSRVWQSHGVRPVIAVMQGAPADLAPDFDALGIERIVLHFPDRGYARYAMLVLKLFLIARRYRARALLSMPLGWHVFMAIGARLAGVRRIVAHVGNYPNVGTGRGLAKFRFLVRLGRPFTDRLICCSHYVEAGATKFFGVPESEMAVIYNGVPIADFARRATSARNGTKDGGPFTIGMVARLEGHKDQPTLIRAARILKNRGRNERVWLIGDGSRRDELQRLIDVENVADRVMLLGMRRDVPELVGSLNLFAFSTTPDEGLGIALIEAMAAGVPIIASDVGACREVLDNGGLGLLVPAGDALALADAVDQVRANPAAAAHRAQSARETAFRDFSIEEMGQRYAALLGLSIAADAVAPPVAPVPALAS